jgi:hypothetical protein
MILAFQCLQVFDLAIKQLRCYFEEVENLVMRKLFLSILGALYLCMHCTGQYYNEWINYNAPHAAFPVVQTGWYQINYAQLLQAGLINGSINPKQFHLFAAGAEVPCEFYGDGDDVLEEGEYYLCWLQGHHGEMEVGAYLDEAKRPDSGYSLFNDTLYHYASVSSTFAPWISQVAMPDNPIVPAHPDIIYDITHALHQNYYIGRADNNGISLPSYDEGEGWFDPAFGTSGYTVQIATPHRNVAVQSVEFSWKVASVNSALGIPNHHLQAGFDNSFQVYFDTTFTGHKLISKTFIQNASNNFNQLTFGFRAIDDLGVASDIMALGSLRCSYRRMPVFDDGNQHQFRVEGIAGADWTTLNLNLDNYQNPMVYAVEGTVTQQLPYVLSGNNLQIWIPWNGEQSQTLMLCEKSEIPLVQNMAPLAMVDFVSEFLAGDFVLLTHRKLLPAATDYSSFKEANGHSAHTIDVEQLYHQYGGGVMKNPLAIRRFLSRLIAEDKKPSHLFIVGKSIHEAPVSGESGARNTPDWYAQNLVPTWGNPGSDVLFTAGLDGTLYEPAIPTGRLAANTTQDVWNYLNKAVEQSTQPAAMWRKNIMHFGGGSIAYEQNIFRNYLNAYKITAEGLHLGGRVHSFFKNTSEPIQLNVSDSIQTLINEGASVMTFFGHASSTGFDQNIDAPESYSNQGKYPLLIGNSCYTGNIHLASSQSASERFVMAANRGVIGFLAKGDLGIPTYLDIYTSNLYRHLFDVSYGASIGECMQRAVADFQSNNDFYEQNVAQTFMLHGDPSVVLFPFDEPDFRIETQDVHLPGIQLAASPESREVKAWITNAGKVSTSNCEILLDHLRPDGTDTTYAQSIAGMYYGDTVTWSIPGLQLVGQHLFTVRIDLPAQLVDEVEDFSNNVVSNLSIVVTDGDIRPVYPYPFAVIDESQPILRASTTYALEPQRAYILQVDTTPMFNSNLFFETQQTQLGGVLSWQLPFVMQDSMVVFWRCSPVDIVPRWRTSSFQYVANRRGWGMQNRYQFEACSSGGVNYSPEEGQWDFETASAQLKCEVYGGADSYFENLATRYQLNLDVQEYGGYGYGLPAIMVAVLDSATLYPWLSNYNGLSPEHEFGNTLISANARGRQEKYFIFQQNDPVQMQGLADMLESGIETGHHVLLYSWIYALPDLWTTALTDAFMDQGLANLSSIGDSLPFIYYFKMGHPETVSGVVGSSSDAFLQWTGQLEGTQGVGWFEAPSIGPSDEWLSAEWAFGSQELSASDELLCQIKGRSPAPTTLLVGSQNEWVMNDQSLENINAISYESLSIRMALTDSASGTLPDIRRLHVWYNEAPEFAMDAHAGFVFSDDTLNEGETLRLTVPVRNMGYVTGDSLLVSYRVLDAKGRLHKIPYAIQDPLAPNAVLIDTIALATNGFVGLNRLIMIINPRDSITGRQHQKEQFEFNNTLEWLFYVKGDKTPPILEVTADGRHILNGEIISATPELLISLRDENIHLLMNALSDTSAFRVYLTQPNGHQITLRFDDPDVEIVPSDGNGRPYRIYYRPSRLQDGLYSLRVQAADKSGNLSGALDYRIDFRVINAASITEMMNYPNPFSTSTRFVFTITGSEVPDEIKIQIMTIGGKVVREILADELGPLYIGRNVTEYAWDGRDEFGDVLANGVYLYRTVVRYHGEEMKHLESGADAYFKEGFGKMYLIR